MASSVRSPTVVRFFRPQLPPTSPLFGSLPLGIMPPASDQIHRPQLKAFLGNQSSEEELQPERKRENKIRMEYLGAENEKCELTRAENYPSRAAARWLLNPESLIKGSNGNNLDTGRQCETLKAQCRREKLANMSLT